MTRFSSRFALAMLGAVLCVTPAYAAEPDASLREEGLKTPLATMDGSQMQSQASHMILLDYNSGAMLAERGSRAKMYPSSMTKLMTLYIIFDRLKQGSVTLDSQFTVSENAWRMQGSKMFVPLGEAIPLRELILGIAVQSGNDACITAAEGIAGSEAQFAQIMNETAKKLGMLDSNFVDASGWPHADHYTSARDLAVLSTALVRDFPEYYHYFKVPEFTYHNIRQYNRNLLLKDPTLGVDGLKTGHTDAAGYGIALSAKEEASGRRLVLVINGLSSEKERAEEGRNLLTWGFRNFRESKLATPGEKLIDARVHMGDKRLLPVTVEKPLVVILSTKTGEAPKVEATYQGPLSAPIKAGDKVGDLRITMPGGRKMQVALVAMEDVTRLGFFGRIGRTLGF